MDRIHDSKGGYILRTACEGHEEGDLKGDMIILQKLWTEVKERYDKVSAPSLLHKDLGIIQRLARDVFTSDISSFILDNQNDYTELLDFVNKFFPHLTDRVKLYSSSTPIFDKFNIETEVVKALKRKVWLKSGGYIVIDQTEALVSIDVNTGKYLGSKSLEETIVRTNIEACREIVRQVRLRNLGGIIIIDFIDMEEVENRELIFSTLENELKNDRAKTTILQISKLGLIEMTRKRVKISLEKLMTRTCPYCQGKGTIKNSMTVLSEIHKEISMNLRKIKNQEFTLRIHPDIAQDFYKNRDLILNDIFGSNHPNLSIRLDPNLHQGNFDIIY
jgi:ribonuclease G